MIPYPFGLYSLVIFYTIIHAVYIEIIDLKKRAGYYTSSLNFLSLSIYS
jgi:hypothetical protein